MLGVGFRRSVTRCAAVALAATVSFSHFGSCTSALSRPALPSGIFGTAALFSNIVKSAACDKASDVPRSIYIDANTARKIDEDLMGPEEGFSIAQLMELAGLSVASAANDFLTRKNSADSGYRKHVLVICGPGNNGGDGLVAARHLQHFGHQVELYFPVPEKNIFNELTMQCKHIGISVLDELPSVVEINHYDMVIDAVFGFSFKGPVRESYKPTISAFAATSAPVLSVDIPSGWDVEKGDIYATKFTPAAVISLTAPKLCMKGFTGDHYVGGRFIPASFSDKYNFKLIPYGNNALQHVLLSSSLGSEPEPKPSAEGWQLYTSSEGFPYYFNHSSGESEWAYFLPPASDVTLKPPAVVVMVTAPDMAVAKKIAHSLVTEKLAACVQLQDRVTSIYEWNNIVEESSEVAMIIKTRQELVEKLTEFIKANHPYDVPEIITVDITGGSQQYLGWLSDMTSTASSAKQ